jgi:hypothetical protein
VLDLRGDLDEVPLRPGGQSFLQRLEQTLSPAQPVPAAPVAKPPPPADPVEAFAQQAAALLGARLVACQERYPEDDGAGAPPILVVVVDREAEAWQPRLAELHTQVCAAGEAGRTPAAGGPRLEVIDRATVQALERLEAMGLIRSRVRATRQLQPAAAATAAPLTDEEKARAADLRRQAAKKLKLGKILLREAARLAGCAFAVEERVATPPATLGAALAPPLSFRWGETVAILQPLEKGEPAEPAAVVAALSRALEPAAG